MKLTNLNELQMPTWRWANINDTELNLGADLEAAYLNKAECTNAGQIKLQPQVAGEPITGLPADMQRMREFVDRHQNYSLTITIPRHVRLEQPVFLDFILDHMSPVLIDRLHIRAEEGSRADIVVTYRAPESGVFFHGGFADLEAASDAGVRLFKIQMLGPKDIHLDTTAVTAAEGGRGDVLLCELGGAQVISSCNIALAGADSGSNLDSLYLGSGRRRLDLNYRLEIRGAASDGEIVVKGALSGAAKKTLKSTLDFISGASGARGREEETVLTLSDHVINLSAPLLLCGEDNVEGEHATTTGRPDETKLYYLMSRGFSEKEAKRLLVEASFTPLLNKIPADRLRGDILSKIQEVVHDEQ